MVKIAKMLGSKIGRAIFRRYQPSFVIVDDVKTNFGPVLLRHASASGYQKIDRIYFVKSKELSRLVKPDGYDVIILDIKGVVDTSIAKDGLQLSELIRRTNSAYLALTSAHQYQLDKRTLSADRIIEDKIMTAVDFVKVLDEITEDLIERKLKLFRRFALKISLFAIKKTAAAYV